jgi:hypothetical protein
MMSQEAVGRLLQRWGRCKAERINLLSKWEEVAELYRPDAMGFLGTVAIGDDRNSLVYDNEGALLAARLRDSLNSMLMPTGERWFDMQADGTAELDDDEAKEWFDTASSEVWERVYDPAAGFAAFVNNWLWDYVCFGAAFGYIGESYDLSGGFEFRTYHLSAAHWYRDQAGRPNSAFLSEKLTADQAAERFGAENLHPDTRRLLEKTGNRDTEIEIVWAVYPRGARDDRSRLATDMRWASVVVETATNHVVRESGYNEFPFIIGEYLRLPNGDLWSLARMALPDTRVLQQQGKTLLRTGQKAADPPIIMSSEGLMSPLSLVAGGVTYADMSQLGPSGKLIERIDVGGNLPITLEMQQEQRAKLSRTFLQDVMTLPDRANMTATEILRRGNDFLRLTAPSFAQLEGSFSKPIIDLCFDLLLRRSVDAGFGPMAPFPTIPESLQGRNVKFKFISPAAKAEREVKLAAVASMVEALQGVIQVRPETLDNFDADELVRDVIAATLGQKFVTRQEIVSQGRQIREQEKQQERQMMAMQAAAGAAKDVTPLLQGQAEKVA